MSELLLLRHAETDGNHVRYVGRLDLPLNEVGRAQALELAQALEPLCVGAVFSSPLARAVATAEPLARPRQLPVQISNGLVEIDYGTVQGMDKSLVRVRLRTWHAETPVPGGESLRDVWHRLQPVASEIIATLEQQTTVVVGHYWSNRLLLGHLTGRSFEESVRADDYKPRNVSAYRLVGSVIDAALRVDAVEWAHPGAQEVIR
jgi:broad specificity phosphatase PhoE